MNLQRSTRYGLYAAAELARGEGGEPPDLELARVDVRGGAHEQLTFGMAPVWSPALSEDGAEVVFVSGAGGEPRLHRMDAAGNVRDPPTRTHA